MKTIGGLEIQPVADVANSFNMLVYGDPGIGKTTLAGSASEIEAMSPVLFLDVEGGTMSLRKDYPDIDVVPINEWTDMPRIHSALLAGTEYKTVVIDSLTEVQKVGMKALMKAVVLKFPERDPDVPSIREWGKNGTQTRDLVRAFRDLPINVIFTALPIIDSDEFNNTHIRPSLSGKLSYEVSGFMDIVLYMNMKNISGTPTRLVRSSSTPNITAKDRSNLLPKIMASPTMGKLFYGDKA